MAMTVRDARQAFDQAIAEGRLSNDPRSSLYAGRFMYMFTQGGVDMFKHIETRRYLTALKLAV